jgi:hypothetical protein
LGQLLEINVCFHQGYVPGKMTVFCDVVPKANRPDGIGSKYLWNVGKFLLDYGDDYVDGWDVRLWTAATKVCIVHPPGVIWELRTTVE